MKIIALWRVDFFRKEWNCLEKYNIEEMQRRIDETEYWDEKILDIKNLYFGDEIEVIIDDDENEDNCWKIVFLSCYSVSYITDADWRKIKFVKEMSNSQLGYYGQDILVEKISKKI